MEYISQSESVPQARETIFEAMKAVDTAKDNLLWKDGNTELVAALVIREAVNDLGADIREATGRITEALDAISAAIAIRPGV